MRRRIGTGLAACGWAFLAVAATASSAAAQQPAVGLSGNISGALSGSVSNGFSDALGAYLGPNPLRSPVTLPGLVFLPSGISGLPSIGGLPPAGDQTFRIVGRGPGASLGIGDGTRGNLPGDQTVLTRGEPPLPGDFTRGSSIYDLTRTAPALADGAAPMGLALSGSGTLGAAGGGFSGAGIYGSVSGVAGETPTGGSGVRGLLGGGGLSGSGSPSIGSQLLGTGGASQLLGR